MPYSSTQAVYRPSRLRLTFTTSARHEDPFALRLENGSGFIMAAREAVRVDGIVLYGPRLKKDGTPGEHIVTEKFYNAKLAPDWAQEAAMTMLTDLGSKNGAPS